MTDTTLTVDLDALAYNYGVLKHFAGAAETGAAVKADAYGMGSEAVGLRLWKEGCRSFFVARLAEGQTLRRALGERDASIYVLDGMTGPADGPRLMASRLIPVLNSLAQVETWITYGDQRWLEAALHVDTGMNRLGLRLEDARALAKNRAKLSKMDVALVMSHLACADDPKNPMSAQQLERFRAVRGLFPAAQGSLANSAGTFLGVAYGFDLVRPGLSLYGAGANGKTDSRLKPVASLHAPILQVRDVPAGETVGYGATFTAVRPVKIAVLAAGYADGLPRTPASSGNAWFANGKRRILGRISMDLLAIDVTGCDEAEPGAMVELVGPNITVDDAAHAGGISAYELLTRLSLRATRRYIGEA